MTIADVLAEAGLSTRAFYRHFTSKSDLLLAIYEHEVELYRPRLAAAPRRRVLTARRARSRGSTSCSRPGSSRAAGQRTRTMFSWAVPLQQEFPVEFAAIRAALTDPLEAVLAAGRADGTFPDTEPARDARFIRALTWELVDDHFSGGTIDVAAARDEVLRFALPALGAATGPS